MLAEHPQRRMHIVLWIHIIIYIGVARMSVYGYKNKMSLASQQEAFSIGISLLR